MFGTEGQKIDGIEGAEAFIHKFMRFEREHEAELAHNKKHDYDLFLPWLMEVVVNAKEEEGSKPPSELDRIYMDAAWSLVQKGYFRPGTHKVSGDTGDGYGKGFTLTQKGEEWLRQEDTDPKRESEPPYDEILPR